MNECLENDDDDEEAHSRSPSCFFTTTPCISGADTDEHTILPPVVPCPDTPSLWSWYQRIFVRTPDWLMEDGLVIL